MANKFLLVADQSCHWQISAHPAKSRRIGQARTAIPHLAAGADTATPTAAFRSLGQVNSASHDLSRGAQTRQGMPYPRNTTIYF